MSPTISDIRVGHLAAAPQAITLVFVVLVSGFASCSFKSSDLCPVSGIVTVDGEPLAAGSVTLHADGTRGNKSLEIGAGKVNEGAYEIFTGQDRGVAPGFYKVVVVSTNFSGNNPPPPGGTAPMPRSLIDRKYSDPMRTPLSFEVVPDAVPGAYDLEVTR